MAAITNARGVKKHDGFASVFEDDVPDQLSLPEHPLDTVDAMRIHAKLLDWYYSALDAHFDNLLEMQLDYDFYDHIQWSDEDRQILAARHQAPLTYNKIKLALDWIVGTERRTRIDWKVHPRSEDDVLAANVKSELLKYLSDVNRIPFERSRAFKDAVICGQGWTNETVRPDRPSNPVEVSWVHWRQMLLDPFSKKLDISDARFVIRKKMVELDYSVAMFPDRANILERSATNHLYADFNADIARDLPQVWRRYDNHGFEVTGRALDGRGHGSAARTHVCLMECWFRRPVTTKRIWGPGYKGVTLDVNNPEHQAIEAAAKENRDLDGKIYSLSNAVKEEIWCAIFTECGLLQLCKSPFRHGQLPFTPYWCYRRDRDGMPYGIVRGIRDAQEDLNKRFSKLLWALSTNQLFYEDGAIEEEDIDRVKEELAKPNGVIKLAKDGLQRIDVKRNLDIAEAQIKMLELDAAHIHDGSGVNREQLGRETNAASGRAILAKQQEGAVATAEPFDQYRLSIQLSGEKALATAEQFMTEEMEFRITGDRKGLEWRRINTPVFNEDTWEWEFENDITRSQADFIVDQQDFRESMRQAYAEQFMEMLTKMPPDTALQLLDLAVEMADIPMKDEVVKRIRAISGQSDPDAEDTPEQEAKRQAQQQQEALSMRERLAKIGLDEAKAADLIGKAKGSNLTNKRAALEVVELLEVLFPLAPAADRLLSDSEPPTAQPAPQEAMYAQ